MNAVNGTDLLIMAGQALLLAALAPLVSGIIKAAKARLQNRRGPRLFQVYFDLAKLLAKDSVVSPTVSWVFTLAPFVYFATAAAAAALTPVLGVLAPALLAGPSDVFMLLYLYVLGRFFLALASLDAGSAFGGMGGSREMFVAVLVEPAILLALLTVAFKSHSTALATMSTWADEGSLGLATIFAAAAFFIVLIAETGRIPVDNPDTHLELTMAHEGMILEYSGRTLGLIFWATSIKQLTLIMLFVVLFLPWSPEGWPLAMQIAVLLGKVVACALSLALAESITNKMRLFRLPGFLAVSGLLSLLAIVAQ